jgi:pantothenate kinase
MMLEFNLDELVSVLINQATSQRKIVAIAGPPCVGKTTITQEMSELINKQRSGMCSILPMDGFHFDDIYLEQMAWRTRKGAPHTFDVDGLAHMLSRLKANNEKQIAVPEFDRSIEIARAGARMIAQSVNIVLTEGNYLLLKRAPWIKLAVYFDTTVMLKASRITLEKRLQNRWLAHGLSSDEISSKLNENDLPNVETVINMSVTADYFILTDKPG